MTGPDPLLKDTADLLDEASALVDAGLDRYGRNLTDQAIACWRRALELDPGNPRAIDYLQTAGWKDQRPVDVPVRPIESTGPNLRIIDDRDAYDARTKGTPLSNVKESLREAMTIEGAIAVALVDYESGMTLGSDGESRFFNIDVAAAGNTQVVRSKLEVMRHLGIEGGIEDILITLDDQYHLIRLLGGTTLFLYIAIQRQRGNLGMARHRLKTIETNLVV